MGVAYKETAKKKPMLIYSIMIKQWVRLRTGLGPAIPEPGEI